MPQHPVGRDRPHQIQKVRKGLDQRQEGSSNNLPQKGRQENQAGSKSKRNKTEDSGLSDQEVENITQKIGFITQRGPMPTKSKIEDINLSDQEVERTTQDRKHQRRRS